MTTEEKHKLPWEVVRAGDGRIYRRSIQAFIMNEKGFFLGFQPVGKSNRDFRQTVQGGVDRGETPRIALARELHEECGLLLGKELQLIGEVLPLSCAFTPTAETDAAEAKEPRNQHDEIVDERRASFRYKSPSWRKMGVFGQELYPFLLFAHSSCKSSVNLSVEGKDREFTRVFWLPLSDFVGHAPPSKRQVLEQIIPAVYHAASLRWSGMMRTSPLPDAVRIIESDYCQRQLAMHRLTVDEGTHTFVASDPSGHAETH